MCKRYSNVSQSLHYILNMCADTRGFEPRITMRWAMLGYPVSNASIAFLNYMYIFWRFNFKPKSTVGTSETGNQVLIYTCETSFHKTGEAAVHLYCLYIYHSTCGIPIISSKIEAGTIQQYGVSPIYRLCCECAFMLIQFYNLHKVNTVRDLRG